MSVGGFIASILLSVIVALVYHGLFTRLVGRKAHVRPISESSARLLLARLFPSLSFSLLTPINVSGMYRQVHFPRGDDVVLQHLEHDFLSASAHAAKGSLTERAMQQVVSLYHHHRG